MSDLIEQSARYWDRQNVAPEEDVRYWLGVLPIREAVNRRLTGDPETLAIARFLDSFADRWPVARALSVGCGAGELERGVVGLGAVASIDGIDVSASSLDLAGQLATQEGVSDRIAYHQSDALSWLEREAANGEGYDVIFFHGCLHHFDELEPIIDATAALLHKRPESMFFIDEYVGPSRDEWTEETLGFAAGLFGQILPRYRRTPHVWAPIAIEDPTEMIRASEIEGIVRQRLEVREYLPYFGNVVMPLVNAIRGTALEQPEVVEVLSEALALEGYLADRRLIEPLYAIFSGGAASTPAQ